MTVHNLSKNISKKCWHSFVFLVIYTSLSLRYEKQSLGAESQPSLLWKSDKKYFKKVLDKRDWMRYYIKADSHRELIKSLRESSVPWKLNNAKGNHAHMISSQMLEQHPRSEPLRRSWLANVAKIKKICANKIWNSITWIILRAIQVLRYIYWRVWSWLRTNAGGVLNTCKSNGKKW